MKRYKSDAQAVEVRMAACEMASAIISAEGGLGDKGRLWSLCVFFESYISDGAKSTRKDFGPVRESKAHKTPVIQLITRD